MRQHRVTSFDVAARAGVSQSTVSRALAGDPVVSQATRERVVAAARDLNYHVDENAARLRTGRTGTIAVVVVCRIGVKRKDVNPFHLALLGAICAAASLAGYETLVSFQDAPDTLFGRYHEQRKADGVIVIGTTSNKPAWDYFGELAREGEHVVCWGAPFDDLAWIRSDNHAGARLATQHLLDGGYRDVLFVGSVATPQRQFEERYEGYAAHLRELGREPRLFEVEDRLSREDQGRDAVRRMAAGGERYDAIFAACDEIALGAIEELRAQGIAVPEQVGVVGFDGIRAGAFAQPPLTTVEPDLEASGTLLVEQLLRAIREEDIGPLRVPVRLITRASARR